MLLLLHPGDTIHLAFRGLPIHSLTATTIPILVWGLGLGPSIPDCGLTTAAPHPQPVLQCLLLHPPPPCLLQVCDFGISKMKDASLAASSTRLQAGTPAYMAPEQFEGCSVTDKVDVFAFGVMLWECFEQQQPWKELSPMQIIYSVGLQVRGG